MERYETLLYRTDDENDQPAKLLSYERLRLSKAYLVPRVGDLVLINGQELQLVVETVDQSHYHYLQVKERWTNDLTPSEWQSREDLELVDSSKLLEFDIEQEDEVGPFEQLIVFLPARSSPTATKHYYEQRRNDLSVFERLLPYHADFYEEFTVNDYVEEIVNIERGVMDNVRELLGRLDYRLDLESDYIVGKGAQGVVVEISNDKNEDLVVAKLFVTTSRPGPYDLELYAAEIGNRAVLVSEGFEESLVPVIESIGRGMLGIIVMPRITETLQQWEDGRTRNEKIEMARELSQLRNDLVARNIFLPDLLPRNIAVVNGRLQLFDLSDMKRFEFYDEKSETKRQEKDQYERTILFLLGEEDRPG